MADDQTELDLGTPCTPQPIEGYRDGATFDDIRDRVRLNRQAQVVWDTMKDGRWRTLAQISAETGEPEASISARLRDFRKPRFGGHIVHRDYVTDGLWRYRLEVQA